MTDPRLVALTPEAIDDAQRSLYDAVLDSPRGREPMRQFILREDGSLTGPFDAWLRTPVLGGFLEKAGMALRADTEVPAAARELAIIVVASAWKADFEWRVHSLVAQIEGVPDEAIAAIAKRRRPELDDPVLLAAHDVAYELVHDRHLADATYARAKEVLGERGLVEVVTAVGFYQLVSSVLESFRPPGPSVDLPAGVPLEQP